MKTRSSVDWRGVKAALGDEVSGEDAKILDHLIAGNSTPEIAKLMNQHRSMVWRKVQSIRKRSEKIDVNSSD